MKNKNKKGSALYFTIVVMTVVLGVSLGMTSVLVNQLRMAREMGSSVIALYGADTGIENFLRNLIVEDNDGPIGSSHSPQPMVNGAVYWVEVVTGGTENCSAEDYCIRSVGRYLGVQRAIEVRIGDEL